MDFDQFSTVALPAVLLVVNHDFSVLDSRLRSLWVWHTLLEQYY